MIVSAWDNDCVEHPKEPTLADMDFYTTSDDGEIRMSVYYKQADGGGWGRDFKLYLSPRQARSIAYSLLWYANDLEDIAEKNRNGRS